MAARLKRMERVSEKSVSQRATIIEQIVSKERHSHMQTRLIEAGWYHVTPLAMTLRSLGAFGAGVVAGLGMGCIFAPMVTVAMRNIEPRMAGAASGVLNTVRQVGLVIGTAAVGALLQNRLVSAMADPASARSAALPPQVVTAEQAKSQGQTPQLNLVLAVRMEEGKLQVEHTGNGEAGFRQVITGYDSTALDQFEGLMSGIRQQFPNNSDVTVIPSDEVSYENIVHVMERLRLARFSGISLGSRARTVAVGGR